MTKEILIETTLPTPGNFPENAITCASRGRWGTSNQPGSLPKMILAVNHLLQNDGIGPDRTMLISDGSDEAQIIPRESVLAQIEKESGNQLETIFFLTPELQEKVVEKVMQKTHLPKKIVSKILLAGEYDGNRLRLDAVQSGIVLQNGRQIKSLSLDDDVIPPEMIKTVKPEVLAAVELEPEPNSFVFWTGEPLGKDDFNYQQNSLLGFFDPLGKKLAELQEEYPGVTLSSGWRDEMHRVMENLHNHPEIFHVTHISSKLTDPADTKDVTIQSVTNTKTRLPDPRTVRYVEQLLWRNLLPPEARIFSYIAGPAKPFAFFKAESAGAITNVDSANMSYLFNQETANIVRWFPSDPNISKTKGMVDWQYRSDNEWLPMLLVKLKKTLGKRYAYFTGIAAETEHHRASTGYRPIDPVEPAAASLIGHEASEAALGRMEFNSNGLPYLNLSGIEETVVPRQNAWHVFLEMRNLQLICSETIVDSHKRLKNETDPERRASLEITIHQFDNIRDSIRRRISGDDFEKFFDRINDEVRSQLVFTNKILKAYPKVIEAVGKMIQNGDYPILEYRPPRERNKNFAKRKVIYNRSKTA